MKHFLFLLFLLAPALAQAQADKNWQLSLQLQPELTIHKKDFSGMFGNGYKGSFNCGAAASVQTDISERFFAEAGFGFISRRINTYVMVDKTILTPSPSGLYTKELNIPGRVAYRTLQFPLGLGVYLRKTEQARLFAKGTVVPNFLINAKYGSSDKFPVYKKHHWQGYSLNAGLGYDYDLNAKFTLTNTLSFSVINTVRPDYITQSQTEKWITLRHWYLQLSTGVKMNL